YSAGSTAVAALQGGTPLLTCLGQTNSSRMGASIVAAAGLETMICDKLESYEQRAVHLATHPQELAEIRRQLIENQATAPLFNPPQFTRYLEQACRTMWEDYLKQKL
ncbi:MAG: TIGR03032 family protein, partial [Gammaproteobacteria bacterium]|nr:TIGR03032 family protein [Gammaproteobacteria bacterium]